jgi:hypothetical protein
MLNVNNIKNYVRYSSKILEISLKNFYIFINLKLIEMKDYENCLILLCLNLWNIMKNFYKALLTHKNYLEEIEFSNFIQKKI